MGCCCEEGVGYLLVIDTLEETEEPNFVTVETVVGPIFYRRYPSYHTSAFGEEVFSVRVVEEWIFLGGQNFLDVQTQLGDP